MHQVRRVLRSHLSVKRHRHRLPAQFTIAKTRQREQKPLLFLWRARQFELLLELFIALRIAAMREDSNQRRYQVAIRRFRIVLESRVQLARPALHVLVLADRAERADQHAPELPLKFALAWLWLPPKPRRRRPYRLSHRRRQRRTVRVGRDHVEIAERADQRTPHIDIRFTAEETRHLQKFAERPHPRDGRRPGIAHQTEPFDRRERTQILRQ